MTRQEQLGDARGELASAIQHIARAADTLSLVRDADIIRRLRALNDQLVGVAADVERQQWVDRRGVDTLELGD